MRLGFLRLAGGLYLAGMVMAGQGAEPPGKKAKANRLIESKSPYLLQHAYNPVDWYPWGEEAFEKARKEKKMILLSVGYSTCHWCHVMERESFQDKKVAEFLNKHFVSVKLDREERPDVDKVYMTSYQAMFGQGGGWPLNMFLTPDLKPFFGGTYFPPKDQGQRPGFMTVLTRLNELWSEDPAGILAKTSEIHQRLTDHLSELQKLQPEADFDATLLSGLPEKFLSRADRVNGGWGQQQKFPQPSHLRFLLRSEGVGREFAVMTCRKMMEGGINDQIGGGFHRYTVDPVWLVPHFEKMLYDNGQLASVYADVHERTGDPFYAEVVRGILDYVRREMTSEDGAFLSAQDVLGLVVCRVGRRRLRRERRVYTLYRLLVRLDQRVDGRVVFQIRGDSVARVDHGVELRAERALPDLLRGLAVDLRGRTFPRAPQNHVARPSRRWRTRARKDYRRRGRASDSFLLAPQPMVLVVLGLAPL